MVALILKIGMLTGLTVFYNFKNIDVKEFIF